MTKETNWGYVLVIAILVLLVGFMFVKYTNNPISESARQLIGDINVNVDSSYPAVLDQQTVDDNPEILQKSLCDIYEKNYPTYFALKELECNNAGGDYVCEQDMMGCYNIGYWNSSLCNSGNAQIQALKSSCILLEGDFTCTASEISCER